ncbi:MAG: hypothetical protein COA57_12335 [Flavobacteriales bacterium]|nr:MAG: hypothetical protein COA57_12335 [Flavobacteriales bacterium]
MAVITKIRNQSTLLFVMIGGAMLLFILDPSAIETFFTSAPETDIGEISGTTISYREFETKVEQASERVKQAQGVFSLDQSTMDQIRNDIWTEYLQNNTILAKAGGAGSAVPSDELFDMVQGKNPHPLVLRNFANPETGQFNPTDVVRYIQSLENDETGQQKVQWKQFEQGLKKDRIATKYYNLIKKGLYVTNIEAKNDHVSKNKTANIRFVAKPYKSISDSAVTIAEEDLENYYEAHEHEPQYQQKETIRSFEYVVFEVNPSEADRQAVIRYTEGLKQLFAESKDDTLFVNSNADTRFNIAYYQQGAFPSEVDSLIYNGDTGTVIGPYFDESDLAYKLAKVSGEKMAPDSVRASHILIKINNNDTATAKAVADSLKKLTEGGADFSELATVNSADVGSAAEGGDLNWFAEGMMVKPFNDVCFAGKVGDMPIVVSQFGVHLIKITGQTEPVRKVLVGIVDSRLESSTETQRGVYQQANAFYINNNDNLEKFKDEANKAGVRVASVRETDKAVSGLGETRELIRWAYAANIDDISKPFDLGDKFVISRLTEIREKGTLPLESVRDYIEAEVLNEKKAEKIISQISGSTIDEVAVSLGDSVQVSENIAFANFGISGITGERDITGHVFGLQQGELSKPIKGKRGVYVIIVDNFIEATVKDYTSNAQQLTQGNQNRVDYEVYEVLKDKADITDNRAKFY